VDSQQPYAEVVAEWEGSWQRPVNGSGVPTGAWTLAPGASSGLGGTGWVATVAYHLGLDRLIRVGQASTHWYLFDGLGSTRALTNGSGVRTDGFDYSAFGVPSTLAGSSGVSNSFLFNAQQWDGWLSSFMPQMAGSELYFLRARYYQPGIGRFVSEDPYSGHDYEPITLHRYLYAASNPINFVDPNGKWAISSIGDVVSSTAIQGIIQRGGWGVSLFARKILESRITIAIARTILGLEAAAIGAGIYNTGLGIYKAITNDGNADLQLASAPLTESYATKNEVERKGRIPVYHYSVAAPWELVGGKLRPGGSSDLGINNALYVTAFGAMSSDVATVYTGLTTADPRPGFEHYRIGRVKWVYQIWVDIKNPKVNLWDWPREGLILGESHFDQYYPVPHGWGSGLDDKKVFALDPTVQPYPANVIAPP